MPDAFRNVHLACLVSMPASAAEPTLTLDVWPDKAPGETGSIGPEKVVDQKPGDKPMKILTNITHPTLSVFRPARDKDTGAAVVICPGGGYNILALDLEGEEVAAWLNSIGVTGIVLKYRVPRREGTPRDRPPVQALMDAQRALSLVRSKAGEWGIDPKRIGILGFSAGGHLSRLGRDPLRRARLCADRRRGQAELPSRLRGADLPGRHGQEGRHIEPDRPRLLDNSAHVPGSRRRRPGGLQEQRGDVPGLKNAKVPAELHIYSSGAMALAFAPATIPVPPGPIAAQEWLRDRQILTPMPRSDGRF